MVLLIFIGCENQNNKISRNVLDLKTHISLKSNPKSTRFIFNKIGDGTFGSSDYVLIAEMGFNKKDFEQIKEQVTLLNSKKISSELTEEDMKFLSPNLKKLYTYNKVTMQYINNDSTYEGDYFFASPLTNGYCVFSKSGNTIFVCLFST